MISFEVQYKHGRHWIPAGAIEASNSRGAALKCSYIHHRRIIRVRPDYSNAKWFVHRFNQPAEVHHGS